jgi:hypothetical protein
MVYLTELVRNLKTIKTDPAKSRFAGWVKRRSSLIATSFQG